MAKFHSGNPFS